eukprot:252639_1
MWQHNNQAERSTNMYAINETNQDIYFEAAAATLNPISIISTAARDRVPMVGGDDPVKALKIKLVSKRNVLALVQQDINKLEMSVKNPLMSKARLQLQKTLQQKWELEQELNDLETELAQLSVTQQ